MNSKKIADGAFVLFCVAFILFLAIFNKNLWFKEPEDIQAGVEYAKAKVVEIIDDTQAPDPDFPYINIGVQTIDFEIISGKYKNTHMTARNFITRIDNKPAQVGTVMVLASYDGFVTGSVEAYNREPLIYGMVLIFLAVILFVGGIKGLKSIFSLAFTLLALLFLFIPLIVQGVNAIFAAVIVVLLSTIVSMYAINGYSVKTFVATVSCVLCTVLAGLLAFFAGNFGNISSLNTNEAYDLLFIAQETNFKVHDLLFAGILIASLGAIMDTAMSVTSSLYEIKTLNPEIRKENLLKSGMNIGKDIMGTMTNTLILAFAGGSINTFVIYYMYKLPYLRLINIDLIVIEFIKGFSGTVAVALSVPITAFLSVLFFAKKSK